jgi:hypothetical protein
MKTFGDVFRKTTAVIAMLTLATVSAFATPTALTTIVLLQNSNVNAPITAGSLSLTFTACDAVNGNSFTSTGREVLIVNNTGGSTYTFTVSSVPDNLNRSDTALTNYSVAAGVIVGVQMKTQIGWLQTGGTINLTCSNAAIKYAVVQYN